MTKASPKNNYHCNKQLQPLANQLRKTMTKGEACLWKYVLGKKQMKGYQFRRQRPILNYIADFMCKELLLIIEVDGISHQDAEAIQRDNKRTEVLQSVGFSVLRFSDWEVLNRMVDVSIRIGAWIDKHAICPPPSPRRRGK